MEESAATNNQQLNSIIPKQTPKFSPSLIATFVLLVVIGAVAGFFLGKSLAKPRPAPVPPIAKITPTPTPILPSLTPPINISLTPTPIVKTTPTIQKWKMWKGIGVSFKYPYSWKANEPVSTIVKPKSGGFYQQSFSSGENMSLGLFTKIRLQKNDGKYVDLEEEFNLPNKYQISIGGKVGLRADYADLYNPEVYNLVAETLLDDATIIGIHLIVQPANATSIEKAKSIFNQILSTFKFLD